MRKVIGIGETILDILLKIANLRQQFRGSVWKELFHWGVWESMHFISETGNDKVGDIILKFMRENGVSTDHVNVFPEGKSPVSLAFLNEQNDAEYLFYKDYPRLRLDVTMPEIHRDDIVMIGSYYAVTPQLRDKERTAG